MCLHKKYRKQRNRGTVALVSAAFVLALGRPMAQPERSTFYERLNTYSSLSNEAKLDHFYKQLERAYDNKEVNRSYWLRLNYTALEYGHTQNEEIWLSGGYGGLSYIYFREREKDSLAYYIDKALLYTPKEEYPSFYLNLASLKLIAYAWQNNRNEATRFSKEVSHWVKTIDKSKITPYYRSKFLYNSALYFHNNNDLLNALPDILMAEEHVRQSHDTELLARILSLKASILEASGEQKALQESLKEAVSIYFQKETPIDSLRALCRLIQVEQDINAAIEIFKQGTLLAENLLNEAYLETRWLYTSLLHHEIV